MHMENIRIGTRASKLALWQANHIAGLLHAGGLGTEIVKIDTKGDKILDVSIAKIGSKGVFTEEIEAQLALGTIDIAVHSAKDMQSELPPGFQLLAFTEREEACDVLIRAKNGDFSLEKEGTKIGTASTRRVAMLRHRYPHLQTVPIRGNLQTRVAKMRDGACDALMLAFAGVHRMGYGDMVAHRFPIDEFVPAVGQGSVAVECATGLAQDKKEKIRHLTNHPPTETRLIAERAFLRCLQGGCSVPVFGLATLQEGILALQGGVVSLDGSQVVDAQATAPATQAELLGDQVAQQVLGKGGGEILEAIKHGA